MSSSAADAQSAMAVRVSTTKDTLAVELSDGRTISVPLAWFPRLSHGTQKERSHWQLIGRGHGVHWPDLDEDISVENLLAGKASGESQASIKRWLEQRTQPKPKKKRVSTTRKPA